MPGARVRLLAAWLAYYRRQRLAGKLNLLFLSLFVVLLLNVLAVFVSLSIVYASNAALWKLERFESRVGAIERTLLRFRISHERGDALGVAYARQAMPALLGEMLAPCGDAGLVAGPDGLVACG